MLLRRISSHLRAENWFAVFMDLLVVIVGLFIGLQVDTWWEGRKEARHEETYLLEIREDFEENLARLEIMRVDLEEIIRSMILLHVQAALEKPTLSVAELNQNFSSIGKMATFGPVNRTYINLTGSGDLKLIQSRLLKNALAEYYASGQIITLVENTHEMELVQIYEPYVINNLDYSAVAISRVDDFPLPPPIDESLILEVLPTRNFRNILTQKWVISTDLLNQNHTMTARTRQVLQLLDSIETKDAAED